jgi:glucose 1-dehydrogenase
MRLQGKTALVTGSSRGIGRGIAQRLAREGAHVAIHYNRDAGEAEEARAEVAAFGNRSAIFRANLAGPGEARRLVEEVDRQFGPIDILVNNAGIEKHAPFWDVKEEDYDAVLNVNTKAVFFATQTLVRLLRARRSPGRIIIISSVHEELPFPNFSPYCVSKGGVKMLARTLPVELKGTGITINAVAPGAIRTPINEKLLQNKEKLNALLAKIPLGRMGEPEDVAGVVAFLASSDADYVTGTTYFVDGGLMWNYEEQ